MTGEKDAPPLPKASAWPHAWLAVGIVVLLAVSFASLVAGTSELSVPALLRALAAGPAAGSSTAATILWGVRMPRLLAALLCGCALSCSGLLLQAALDNSLAAPSVMGVNSGAGLLCLVAGLVAPYSAAARQLGSFAGAMLAALLVFAVSRRAGTGKTTLVLAGVAVSSLMSAGIDAIVTVRPDVVTDRVSFTLGSVAGVSYSQLAAAVVPVAACLVPAFLIGVGVDSLALGDEVAHGLGVNVRAYRLGALAIAALLAASAVSVCGLVSFLGLIVPNVVRLRLRCGLRGRLAACAVWGAAFLALCDLVARTVLYPYELPVGLVLSLLGAPFFIMLLVRRHHGFGGGGLGA
ncbi:MAG: iron ABC transporter permease [Coriobacteriaceae bacterium]|nr:MAG: iron ABC transporter permease [Coriobacteriaceae bacterium]